MSRKARKGFQASSWGWKGISRANAKQTAAPNPNPVAKTEKLKGKRWMNHPLIRVRKAPPAPIPRSARLIIRKAMW